MKTNKTNNDDESDGATPVKRDLTGDRLNFCLLLLLYTLQGFPLGLTSTLQILLQSRKMVTYEQQAWFSVVTWPFMFKIIWAPIVDSLYVQWIGRRKTWLMPLQYLSGLILLLMSNNINGWLPKTGKSNLNMIICAIFTMNLLAATQDIVVDGWALTMLKKKNVSYASICNSLGVAIGQFFGSVCLTLLSSDEFKKKYFQSAHVTDELISFQNCLLIWSILFLSITTFVGVFKKEKDTRLEDFHVRINVLQNYKLLWNVLKLPHIIILAIALLTARIGFSAMDTVSNLKLIDAGVSKDDIMIISTGMYAVKCILPFFVTKLIMGPKPMSVYIKFTIMRLLWPIVYVVLIYYTPSLIHKNGTNIVPMYYYIVLGLIIAINEIMNFILLLMLYVFICRISDPRFGGTYMTLFNTFYALGWFVSNTVALKMVAVLTFNTCSNDVLNDCSTPFLNKTCAARGGNCAIYLDGYYVTILLCMVVGFVWCFAFRNKLLSYESMAPSEWMVNVKKLYSKDVNELTTP